MQRCFLARSTSRKSVYWESSGWIHVGDVRRPEVKGEMGQFGDLPFWDRLRAGFDRLDGAQSELRSQPRLRSSAMYAA